MATFTVTTASDAVNPAGLSLREALASADANPGADTIYFGPILNDTTIILTQGELTIASDVTIDGGELQVTIDADSQSRALRIEAGTDVTLDSLHITGGHSTSSGGGILAGAGTSLTVVDTEVVRNSVNGDNLEVLRGGGIYTGGSLVLRGSTVSDNAISGAGQGGGIAAADVSLFQSTVAANYAGDAGGIFSGNVTLDASTVHHNTVNAPNAVSHGGGIYAGSVTLTNSTVAFNRADSFSPGISIGGGIYAPGGVVSLTDSTLTGNYASRYGGAVYAGSITVANSIIVGNAATFSGYDISGAVTNSNGHNLFGSAVSGSLPGDVQNVTAQSVFAAVTQFAGSDVVGGALADNGGPTETVALLDASTNPALGRGESIASLTTDQRGESRPSVNPDIGAFELEQSHATAVGTPGIKLLQGSSDSEALLGLAQAEVLHGGRGNDLLDGGKGADRLRGGPGSDALIGGGASDRFIFAEASHSAPATPDAILDFSQRQGDRIVLRGLDGDLDQPGDQPLEFIGRHRFTDAGQVMEQVIDGHTVVRVNLDGDPRAELSIQLHDIIDLHRADFVL